MIYKKQTEKLVIAIKVKDFIKTVRGITINLPNKEKVLKDKLIEDSILLLEYIYKANFTTKDKGEFLVDILSKISMIDYYLEVVYMDKYLSERHLNVLCKKLEEITKMVYGWVYSVNKQGKL